MAHGSQRRASDGHLFLEHVVEVATLLHRSGASQELVAVGLLHDSVERGTLSEAELRNEMGEAIGSLVMALSEDPSVEPFEQRKTALREQVVAAGDGAVTVFAADKLSCIMGLRRGIEADAKAVEERAGSRLGRLIDHYRDSVESVASADPESTFLPMLRSEFEHLASAFPPSTEAGGKT
jgi:(p)ppGpp synthase/HD superfamily hydrolase